MSDYPPPPPPSGPYYPDPNSGQYPSGQYPPGQYPPGEPRPTSPFAGLSARLGDRLSRRPEPRLTVAIAGVGATLVLFGVLLWGGDYIGGASSPDTSRNLLGAALGAIVTALGFVVAISARQGPLATAGVVATGIGMPLTLFWLTLDFTDVSGGLPFNLDVTFWVSTIVWLVCYLVVPGMRGHTFFVFLIADVFFTYVLFKSSVSTTTVVEVAPGGSGPRITDLGTIAAIGLVIGLAYYAIAFLLDRAGRHGPATGLVYPAFGATASGIIAWSSDLHQVGTGIVTILVGVLVCWYGGRYGRRVTCFAAGAAVVVGIGLLVQDATDDATAAGITFILVGAIVVAAATLLASGLGERDDMDPEAIVRSR